MKRTLFLMAACSMLVGAVYAGNGDRLEVTVHSGWSFLNVDQRLPQCSLCVVSFFGVTTTVDSSPEFGVKAGYYLTDHAEVEGQFAISPSHKVVLDNSFVCPPGQICPLADLYFPFFHTEHNMVAYQYGGNFVFNFTRSDVRPFVTFGIGGLSSAVDANTSSDFAFQFGGGAKIFFHQAGLRFEVVDQVVPNYFLTGKTQHDLQIQYGVVFRVR